MTKALGVVVAALAAAACGGGSNGKSSASTEPTPTPTTSTPPAATPLPTTPDTPTPPSTTTTTPPTPAPPPPPVTLDAWTFYSTDQGLSASPNDVSADEAGNVYVAGYDALYVKQRGETAFKKFDAAAGLTKNCYGSTDAERQAFIRVAQPKDGAGNPLPLSMCPVISVAGTSAGKAVIGFKGVGTDSDADATWAIYSGGADVVSFDGTTVTRDRHVLVASPPGVICEFPICSVVDPTDPTGVKCLTPELGSDGYPICHPWGTWTDGRLKLRQVQRIVVNRKPGIGQGDVAMGGTHSNVTVLVAKPGDRGWVDLAKGDPAWADTKYVWEHEHPYDTVSGVFLTGEAWALGFDPASGNLWTSNQFRTFHVGLYNSMTRPTVHQWWGDNVYLPALWAPQMDPFDGAGRDNVQSLSFCNDGTMWIASLGHGLARVRSDGSVSYFSVPVPGGDLLASVACDPSDSSVWVGSAFDGGIHRLKNGQWSTIPAGAPAFALTGPVRSIQIDRWATPRIVYFAHLSQTQTTTNPDGTKSTVVLPGGVSAYAGP